jgi:hypothetical protein
MIKFTLVFICVLFYSNLSSQIEFEFRLGSPDFNEGFGAAVCDSQGNIYVSYGYQLLNTNPTAGISWLYQIDPEGDTLKINFQKQDTIILFKPFIDSEENLLLIGEGYKMDTSGNLSGKFHIFIKMTTSFEIIWQKYFYLESNSEKYYTEVETETNRNSYIHAAVVRDSNTGLFRMYSFELDKDGDSLNYFNHESELLGFLYSVTQSPDDSTLLEYHLTVTSTSDSSTCGRLQLDESFQYVSVQAYPEHNYRDPFYTMRFRNQTYISGGSHGFNRDHLQMRIMDTSLNILNSINLNYNEDEIIPAWNKCIDYYDTNRVFIVGTTPYREPYQANYIYVACLNSNLDIIHEEYLGGDEHYDVWYISATPDGGIVISGSYNDVSEDPLQRDGYLIKLDSSMFVGMPEYQMIKKEMLIEVFPSPAHGQVTISSDITNYDIKLLDLTGKVIMEHQIRDKAENIDISHVKPGLYLLNAKSGQLSNIQKLLIY